MRNLFLTGLLICVFCICPGALADGPPNKLIGMYVHQHWPYNHPYAARTWTVEDWRGYADGLKKLGYNSVLIWPLLETMPNPLTSSDRANLRKIARVIDMLHQEFDMRAYIVLCPNVVARDKEAAQATFEKRHYFYCDMRINPADPAAMKRMLDWRKKLFASLAKVDGVAIIDSDPGGYPGSTNEEFVDLLVGHRKMLDELRPGIELYYWMHAGWLGYGRFYQTGTLSFSTDEENTAMLSLLKSRNPEPWGIANGLAYAQKLGIANRVVSFNYGRIEAEPSFPMSNFGGTNAYEGGSLPAARGVMGNAQTHCVQLPNTFAFARGAAGKPVTETDYVDFADKLIPGQGQTIVRAWKALAGSDPEAMRACAAELTKIPAGRLKPGPLKGLLFGSPRRFVDDLVMMLRVRAGFEALRVATDQGGPTTEALGGFVTAAKAWQHRHGYENTWWWPGLDEVLRKLNSPEVNLVLDGRFNPFAQPKLLPDETPFEYVARKLREEESHTLRLLKAMEVSAARGSSRPNQGANRRPLFEKMRPDWEIKFSDASNSVLSVMPGESAKAFYDPLIKRQVRWEQDVYCPTFTVFSNKLYCLYRAWGDDEQWRLGLAWSDDGLHFTRSDMPVFSPKPEDTFLGALRDLKDTSVSYGDPKIFAGEDGTLYVLFNYFSVGKMNVQELAVATTRDMRTWTMHGRIFARQAAKDMEVIPEHAPWRFPHPAIVSRLEGSRFVATKLLGKYWMYLNCLSTKGPNRLCLATSENMLDWEMVRNAQGNLVQPMPLRPGCFDSRYVDTTAAVLRDDGILLIYNGINADPKTEGDPRLTLASHYPAQALFDKDDPSRLLKRGETPFKGGDAELEKQSIVFWDAPLYESWSLVPWNGELLLYWNHAFGRRSVGLWKAPIRGSLIKVAESSKIRK